MYVNVLFLESHMENCFKRLKHLIGVTGFALVSLSSHATCTTIGTTGVVGFNIAVASNFSLSAQAIAANFLAIGPKPYDIHICDGSSSALFNVIVPSNSSQYALFLSADTTRPAALRASPYTALTLADPFTYAKGTPAFLLSPAAYSATSGSYRAVNYLNTGLGSGAIAERSDASLSSVSNSVAVKMSGSPSVANLAIGDPTYAPYGVATQDILTEMGQWPGTGLAGTTNASTNVTTACSSLGGNWICRYDNINHTLDAINNDAVTAGFVSYGQICPALTGTTYALDRYVLFPDYQTIQDGILLDVTDNTAETKAAAFLSYMLGGAGSTDWNAWLTSHCYQAL